MFAHERREAILNILNTEGKVVVKDICARFQVTEDCIRKDLKILENDSLLKRTYGGAVPVRKMAHIDNIESRMHSDIELKSVIAKKAFDIIEEDDTIFLDISSINILLAEMLAKSFKKVTVITNMLDVLVALNSVNNSIKVISLGGVLNKEYNGFTGFMTIENIASYRLSKSFIGSIGVNVFDRSITTGDIDDGNTKKALIKNSQKTYLVMENSKFYFDGTYKFAALEDINAIITEEAPKKEIIKALSKTGTVII